MQIDLHIGVEKTGTTAIQAYLRQCREYYREHHGILYPECFGVQQSTKLTAAFQQPDKRDDLRMILGIKSSREVVAYREQLYRDFRAELAGWEPEQIVISNEHLSSRLDSPDEVEELQRFLSRFSSRIRVWVYLRRQDALALSLYSTGVKSGRTESLRFFNMDKERRDFHFDKLLAKWGEVFGDDHVHPRIYDRSALLQGDVVVDFCNALELPLVKENLVGDENVAFSVQMLDFLRQFNHFVPGFIDGEVNPDRADIVAVLDHTGMEGDELGVGVEDMETLLKAFAPGNDQVAKRYFAPRTTLFEPPGATSENTVGRQFDRNQLMELVSKIWVAKQRTQARLQRRLTRQMLMTKVVQAELAIERSNLPRAQLLLEEVVEVRDDIPRAHFLLSVLHIRLDNLTESGQYIQRAVALAPENKEFRNFINLHFPARDIDRG